MIIAKNQHVKCILKNGTIVEGIVELWATNEIILISIDKCSKLVIPHPDDIVLIKITIQEYKTELEKKFQQELEKPSDDALRLESMVKLKQKLNDQEKLIQANKLREFTLGEVKEVKYEQPRFNKKQGSE